MEFLNSKYQFTQQMSEACVAARNIQDKNQTQKFDSFQKGVFCPAQKIKLL